MAPSFRQRWPWLSCFCCCCCYCVVLLCSAGNLESTGENHLSAFLRAAEKLQNDYWSTNVPVPFKRRRDAYSRRSDGGENRFYAAEVHSSGTVQERDSFKPLADDVELSLQDDNAGLIEFVSDVFTVSAPGRAYVKVRRSGGVSGEVSASVSTLDGRRAKAGQHFSSVSVSVSWSDQQRGLRTIPIEILGGPTNVGRNFTVRLRQLSTSVGTRLHYASVSILPIQSCSDVGFYVSNHTQTLYFCNGAAVSAQQYNAIRSGAASLPDNVTCGEVDEFFRNRSVSLPPVAFCISPFLLPIESDHCTYWAQCQLVQQCNTSQVLVSGCICPRDRDLVSCGLQRPFQCDIKKHLFNCNPPEVAPSLPLFQYNERLMGERPCLHYRETDTVIFPFAVICSFLSQQTGVIDMPASEQAQYVNFTYAILNSTNNFALREIPELSIELSAIDMNALFDYSHEIHYQLSPLQLQGRNPAQFDFNLGLLEKRFITSGRVFLEAAMYSEDPATPMSLGSSGLLLNTVEILGWTPPPFQSTSESFKKIITIVILLGISVAVIVSLVVKRLHSKRISIN